jgi:hypothetical protein
MGPAFLFLVAGAGFEPNPPAQDKHTPSRPVRIDLQ